MLVHPNSTSYPTLIMTNSPRVPARELLYLNLSFFIEKTTPVAGSYLKTKTWTVEKLKLKNWKNNKSLAISFLSGALVQKLVNPNN